MRLLGPEGARQRLAQIESRIASFSAPASQFYEALQGAIGTAPADPSSFSVQPNANLRSAALDAASRNGVDPKVFMALVNAESGWNPNATSRKGATGLTQLMPGTAAGLGVANTLDPMQSLNGGARYLRQMLDRYGGDYPKALAAYNAGPARVDQAGGVPSIPETVAYVRKIMKEAGSTQ